MQLMAHTLGGKVEKANTREYGKAEIEVTKDNKLFGELTKKPSCLDESWRPCNRSPEGFEIIATSPCLSNCCNGK